MSGPWRAPSRLWVVIPVGLALALAAFVALRGRAPVADSSRVTVSPPDEDALERCREAGEAGPRDPACRALWRAARERFLGGRP